MQTVEKRKSILLAPCGITKSDYEDVLICVTTDGFIYYFPIKKTLPDYLFSSTTSVPPLIPAIIKRQSTAFSNQKLSITDIIAYHQNLKPHCIGKFIPIPEKSMMSAELSFDKKLLFVKGVLYQNVPSYVLYSLKQNSVEILYVEPMLGVIDMCFHSNSYTILALPRCLNGIISQLTFPNPFPEHFNHRIIPQMTFLGHSSKRSHHIIASPTSTHHQFATWSDEEIPQISLWRIALDGQILRWFETTMQFTIPLFIQCVAFDANGDRIGFVMSTGNYTAMTIWELKKDQNKQNTFIIPDDLFGEVICGKWGDTFNEDSDSYYVLTTKGLFMHNGVHITMWKQPTVKMTNFLISDELSIFYVNENCELHFISPHEGDPNGGAITLNCERPKPIPFVKATTKGECDLVYPVHLHRCANCRMPLIQPLICKENGLECCYCSRECQEEHWPTYVAIHQPVSFETDFQNFFGNQNTQKQRLSMMKK